MLRRAATSADLRPCAAKSAAYSPTNAHRRLAMRLIDSGANALLSTTAFLRSMARRTGPHAPTIRPTRRQEALSPPRLASSGTLALGVHAGWRGSVKSAMSGRWALRQPHSRRSPPAGETNGWRATDRAHPESSALALGLPWAHRGLDRQPRHRPQAGVAKELPLPQLSSSRGRRRRIDDMQSSRPPQAACLAAARPRDAPSNDCSTELASDGQRQRPAGHRPDSEMRQV
jgi:hypothetical protein